MNCKHCKKQIDDDSKFCEYCGKVQTEQLKYSKGNLDPFQKGSLWGLKDKDTRDIIIPPKYSSIGPFIENWAVVNRKNKHTFIDKNGIELTPLKYDFVEQFKEGFAKVKIDDKWALINEKGKEITSFKYERIDDFINDRAKVQCDGLWSFINENGKEIAPFKYKDVSDFNNNISRVKSIDGLWGVLNKDGELIIDCKYCNIEETNYGLLKLQSNDSKSDKNVMWGVADNTGEVIFNLKYLYPNIRILNEKEIAIKDKGSWKCYDTMGALIDDPSDKFKKIVKNQQKKNWIKKLPILLLSVICMLIYIGFLNTSKNWSGDWKINDKYFDEKIAKYKKECTSNYNRLPQSYKDFINNLPQYTFKLKVEFEIGKFPFRKAIYIYNGSNLIKTKNSKEFNSHSIPILKSGNDLMVCIWKAYGEQRIEILDQFNQYDFYCFSIGNYFVLKEVK